MANDSRDAPHVLITGGAGYIGSLLVPTLLAAGHRVTVFDIMLFGDAPLAPHASHDNLRIVRRDIRDHDAVARAFGDSAVDAVIHLAAISNDPSSELDPVVTEAVNGAAVDHLMKAAKRAGVSRFLYASSASVYGIKDTEDVTEDLPLEPITLYAKCKARGEETLGGLASGDFVGISVRAATVCGFAPRLRLDLTVNLLTDQALTKKKITVFGGSQMRPNVHVRDLVDFYVSLLTAEPARVNGEAFNVSYENASVMAIAEVVRDHVDGSLPIEVVPTDDVRSYHLSSAKAGDVLGYRARTSLGAAVDELAAAFARGEVRDPASAWYRNVAWMKAHPEKWKR